MTFTPLHEAKLRAAVDDLNSAMEQIVRECGDNVRVRAWANYRDDSGAPNVQVEVTTGLVRFGPH